MQGHFEAEGLISGIFMQTKGGRIIVDLMVEEEEMDIKTAAVVFKIVKIGVTEDMVEEEEMGIKTVVGFRIVEIRVTEDVVEVVGGASEKRRKVAGVEKNEQFKET